MATLHQNILSCLLSTAIFYSKCSPHIDKQAAVLYSRKKDSIVSMGCNGLGFGGEECPEFDMFQKLSWYEKFWDNEYFVVTTHAPTANGANVLIRLKIKELFYLHPNHHVGIITLKKHHILSTRLVYEV